MEVMKQNPNIKSSLKKTIPTSMISRQKLLLLNLHIGQFSRGSFRNQSYLAQQVLVLHSQDVEIARNNLFRRISRRKQLAEELGTLNKERRASCYCSECGKYSKKIKILQLSGLTLQNKEKNQNKSIKIENIRYRIEQSIFTFMLKYKLKGQKEQFDSDLFLHRTSQRAQTQKKNIIKHNIDDNLNLKSNSVDFTRNIIITILPLTQQIKQMIIKFNHVAILWKKSISKVKISLIFGRGSQKSHQRTRSQQPNNCKKNYSVQENMRNWRRQKIEEWSSLHSPIKNIYSSFAKKVLSPNYELSPINDRGLKKSHCELEELEHNQKYYLGQLSVPQLQPQFKQLKSEYLTKPLVFKYLSDKSKKSFENKQKDKQIQQNLIFLNSNQVSRNSECQSMKSNSLISLQQQHYLNQQNKLIKSNLNEIPSRKSISKNNQQNIPKIFIIRSERNIQQTSIITEQQINCTQQRNPSTSPARVNRSKNIINEQKQQSSQIQFIQAKKILLKK